MLSKILNLFKKEQIKENYKLKEIYKINSKLSPLNIKINENLMAKTNHLPKRNLFKEQLKLKVEGNYFLIKKIEKQKEPKKKTIKKSKKTEKEILLEEINILFDRIENPKQINYKELNLRKSNKLLINYLKIISKESRPNYKILEHYKKKIKKYTRDLNIKLPSIKINEKEEEKILIEEYKKQQELKNVENPLKEKENINKEIPKKEIETKVEENSKLENQFFKVFGKKLDEKTKVEDDNEDKDDNTVEIRFK